MQAIEPKKHQNMIRVIEKFEELLSVCGPMVPEAKEEVVKKNITEFKTTYDHYIQLLKEMENCISSYKTLHKSLEKRLYPNVRKMNTQLRKKGKILVHDPAKLPEVIKKIGR